jgi:hypothetical protein
MIYSHDARPPGGPATSDTPDETSAQRIGKCVTCERFAMEGTPSCPESPDRLHHIAPPSPALAAWIDLAKRIGPITMDLEISAGSRPWEGAEIDITDREAMLKALDHLAQSAAILRRVIAERG